MPGTRKLGRPTGHRNLMIRGQVTYLLENGSMYTTVTRAKEVRSMTEKMITLGKKNTLATRRQALSYITKEDVVTKLFSEIAPKFKKRTGGYTQIIKIGPRRGDAADMALIQIIGYEKLKAKEAKKNDKKGADSKKAADTKTTAAKAEADSKDTAVKAEKTEEKAAPAKTATKKAPAAKKETTAKTAAKKAPAAKKETASKTTAKKATAAKTTAKKETATKTTAKKETATKKASTAKPKSDAKKTEKVSEDKKETK